ncbi:MAG: sigma-70 family RNA polymerase sigma factor [Aeromicrobium sp.]
MAARSDAARVTQLVQDHSSALLGYFVRRVDDPSDAADLLGDLLTVVWRRRSSVPSDDTEARMWMYGVARLTLSTYRRGRRRRHTLQDRLREELAVEPVDEPHDVTEVLEALRELDPIDQEIIRLVHWDGFTQADAARLLDMPAATVRSRYFRARGVLRTRLESLASVSD